MTDTGTQTYNFSTGTLLPDLVHAWKTRDNDPGNHKKKALLGAAATGTGVAVLAPLLGAKALKNIKNSANVGAKLTAAMVPAGILYAVHNKENRNKVIGGTGTALTGAALFHHNYINNKALQKAYRNSKRVPIISDAKIIAAAGLPVASAMYTASELGKMHKEESGENYKELDYVFPLPNYVVKGSRKLLKMLINKKGIIYNDYRD